jgi:hypothetical protein
VSGAFSIAVVIIFLSGDGSNSPRAEGAFLGSNPAASSRTSPVVWLHEGQNRRSIFVTRRLAGDAWIEGLAITGENASSQILTGVRGVMKMDSGKEIKLGFNTEGGQGKWADTQDVPPGSKFTFKSALDPDATQTGMPASEFLSKHGGMIFHVSYAAAGVQTTLIEYLSTSKLKAQLADIN